MSWLTFRESLWKLIEKEESGECKVPCVVTNVYTTHVTQAKVGVCFCVRWISLILSGGSEHVVLLQLCECVSV